MDGGRRAGRPGGDYGSEGWGFESLRARHIIPAQRPFSFRVCRAVAAASALFEYHSVAKRFSGEGMLGRATCVRVATAQGTAGLG